jgi:hypothetical protein
MACSIPIYVEHEYARRRLRLHRRLGRSPRTSIFAGFAPKWIACRPRYFLTVEVLSALFRRLFLEMLVAVYHYG